MVRKGFYRYGILDKVKYFPLINMYWNFTTVKFRKNNLSEWNQGTPMYLKGWIRTKHIAPVYLYFIRSFCPDDGNGH